MIRLATGMTVARPEKIAIYHGAKARQVPVILLADDSFIPREMTRIILRDAGYQVKTVSNGEEAINLLSEHPVRLLISDIEMPVMNGAQLTRTMKGMPEWSHIPIIILSTFNHEELIEKGLDCPADAFFTKRQFQHTRLLDTIKQLLGENNTDEAPAGLHPGQ